MQINQTIMSTRKYVLSFAALMVILTGLLNAQDPIESITKAEIRDHIFFLASDYMNGRVGPSAEYEIAAQYVAAQFAGAGLKPAIKREEGNMDYFQGVPFIKITYSDDIKWKLLKEGKEIPLQHKEDFRIIFGNKLTHNKEELVWVGYGIEEPDHNWNDFEKLDVKGKIIVCIGGAPTRNGEPVLPEEVHNEYSGLLGSQMKVSALFRKGAEGIIFADLHGSTGMPLAENVRMIG